MSNKETLELRRILTHLGLEILVAGLLFFLLLFIGKDDFTLVCILGLVIGMVSIGISFLADFILGWIKVSSAERRIKTMFILPYGALLFIFLLMAHFFADDLIKDFAKTGLLLIGILFAGAVPTSLAALYFLWDSRKMTDGQEGYVTSFFSNMFTEITGFSSEKDQDKNSKKYKRTHAIYIVSLLLFTVIFLFFRRG